MYPALNCDREEFTPAVLLAIDDPFLNTTFLSLVLKYYCEDVEGVDIKKDYFLSPILLPDSILAKFPQTSIFIAGIDPIRDDIYYQRTR